MSNRLWLIAAALPLVFFAITSCGGKNSDVQGGWNITDGQTTDSKVFFTSDDMMFMTGSISRGRYCVIDEVNLTAPNSDILLPIMLREDVKQAVAGKIRWRGKNRFEYLRYFYPSSAKLIVLDGGTYDIISVSDNEIVMQRSQLRAKSNGEVTLEPVDTLTMSRIDCTKATCETNHLLKTFSAQAPRGVPVPYHNFSTSPVVSTLITISGSGKQTEIKPDECPRSLDFL